MHGRAVTIVAMVPSAQDMDPAAKSPSPPPVLGRVATGDAAATRECLERYGNLVWSIARRFESVEVEDAVQEIFLDLWKSAARFDPAIASEPAFVAMIARRRLIDRRRSRMRRPAADTPLAGDSSDGLLAVDPNPSTSPDTCVEAKQAARALEQLRPEQREVLVLSTVGGLSHGEIADATGLPLGTVKAHVRRGLLSIRAALGGVDQGGIP